MMYCRTSPWLRALVIAICATQLLTVAPMHAASLDEYELKTVKIGRAHV